MDCHTHDHSPTGECLEIEWLGVAEEREGYGIVPSLTQEQLDQRQEEIKIINQENRKKVAQANKAPF